MPNDEAHPQAPTHFGGSSWADKTAQARQIQGVAFTTAAPPIAIEIFFLPTPVGISRGKKARGIKGLAESKTGSRPERYPATLRWLTT